MPLPSSGPIRMGADVNVELGNSATAQISLGQSSVRSLYGVASGAIRLAADGYGKSSAFAFTISTNQQEANLRTLALAAGWNGTSSVTATVSAGVYIWSNNTGTAALTINGSWPGGVTLVNNGYIIGRGGNGGTGYWNAPSSGAMAGNAGGPAISLGINATITNNSGAYIAGGGGGGAGAGIVGFGVTGGGGGGGAGGGTGGSVINAGGGSSTTAGGAGGGLGASGSNGSLTPNAADGSGGGGGRILPGTGGAGGVSGNLTGKGGGSGGGGGHGDIYYTSGSGGAGGSAGSVGGNATASDGGNGGGGGGWGASGGTGSTGSASVGGGGKAIALNGFTATRSGSGTTYGAVS